MKEKTVFGRRLPVFLRPRCGEQTPPGIAHSQLERRGISNSWQLLEICLDALILAACERRGDRVRESPSVPAHLNKRFICGASSSPFPELTPSKCR
jgi:hypothetical protein